MNDPWWAATITAVKGYRSSLYYLKSQPCYRVRHDKEVVPQGVVSLFLKACNVHEDHRREFFDYLGWVQVFYK